MEVMQRLLRRGANLVGQQAQANHAGDGGRVSFGDAAVRFRQNQHAQAAPGAVRKRFANRRKMRIIQYKRRCA